MRVVVDSDALEALCQTAEAKQRHLVAKLRSTVRAEPKTEAVTKVADYSATDVAAPVGVPINYGATTPSRSTNSKISDR